MIVNLVRGRSIDCGCLGVSAKTPVSWMLVTRNFVLIAGAAAVAGTGGVGTVSIVPSLLTGAAAAAVLALVGSAARTRAAIGRLTLEPQR